MQESYLRDGEAGWATASLAGTDIGAGLRELGASALDFSFINHRRSVDSFERAGERVLVTS